MPARFDPALIQRGARLRRSPFFEATQRAGCLGYTIYNHMIEIDGARLDLNMTRYPVRGGGHVTSCVYSPRLKKNIGYAMLPLPMATGLEIETPDGVRRAAVVPMPFIDPKKLLAKES